MSHHLCRWMVVGVLSVGCVSSCARQKGVANPEQPAASVAPELDPAMITEQEKTPPVAVSDGVPWEVRALDGGASTAVYMIVDEAGNEVTLPEAVATGVREALYPQLVLDKEGVVYDHGEKLWLYRFDASEPVALVELRPHTDMVQYGWEDGGRIAVVERLPSCPENKSCSSEKVQEPDDVWVRLVSLPTMDEHVDDQIVASSAYAIEPLIRCGSVCQVAELKIIGEGRGVRYLVKGGKLDPGATGEAEPEYREVEIEEE